MIRDDYAKVGVPMLPVVAGNEATTKQIWLYTLVLIPSTFLLIYPINVSGVVYGALAAFLATIFIKKAWELRLEPDSKELARSLFFYSIIYMMALSAAMIVDSLPVTHYLVSAVATSLQALVSG